MQDVGQSEALAKQSVKCKKRAFSCEKYGLVRQPDQPLDLKTWLIYIEASLASFIRVGAIAAWAGFEDSSPCPEIFDTNIMAGNAFAANTPNFGFMCNATLENPTSPLTLTQMNWIWVEIGRNRSKS